ncbi:Hypothetical protein HVR_LOCUS1216 [uncultured virus]|nr:Hypothetical protein HVR_LOCUS1216 [uncultured virus]
MFNWGKNSDKVAKRVGATPESLKEYFDILTGADEGNDFKAGDYVKLKNRLFLPRKYAGCVGSFDATITENVYAYVLERTYPELLNSPTGEPVCPSKGHIPLGTKHDLTLAVPRETKIDIRTCDSRMFRSINRSVNSLDEKLVSHILREFVADTPIVDVENGKLVRPRVHTSIEYESYAKMSSFISSKTLDAPLMIVGTTGKKVYVAGVGDDELIHEISVYPNLLCNVEV